MGISFCFFVNFERFYSIGKISVGFFIALGLFSISRNLEPTARKDKLDNLCSKYNAQIRIRKKFESSLSEKNNNIQENIEKTSKELESHMKIKKRFSDKGDYSGEYLYGGDSICFNKFRGYGYAY